MSNRVMSLARSGVMLLVVGLLAGCVGTTTGQLNLAPDAARQATYFVELHDKDARNLAATIAERMQVRGLRAVSGTSAQRSPEAQYVVTYTDRWMWDMRMYLFDLRIDLRDAGTQSIVGYGQSMQSSLKAMGKSHADIVDAALDQLFGARVSAAKP
jgi:hypothetical protein